MSKDRYRDYWEPMPDNWYSSVTCGECPGSHAYTVNTTYTPSFIASIMIGWHKRKVHNGKR